MGLTSGSVAEHAPMSSTEPKAEAIKIVRADGVGFKSEIRRGRDDEPSSRFLQPDSPYLGAPPGQLEDVE